MRASITASDKPRYFSGRGWRSEMCSFSSSVISGIIVDGMFYFVKLFAISKREKGQTHRRAIAPWSLDLWKLYRVGGDDQRIRPINGGRGRFNTPEGLP